MDRIAEYPLDHARDVRRVPVVGVLGVNVVHLAQYVRPAALDVVRPVRLPPVADDRPCPLSKDLFEHLAAARVADDV